jgi:hypothetical protein
MEATGMKQFMPLLICIFLLSNVSSYAQHNYWKDLARVTIEEKTDENGFPVEFPVFHDDLKTIEGDKIILEGYMVPLEEMMGHKYFVLSKYPFNMCFFCGAAGPETVIEVYITEEVAFTSDKIKIQGTLELNKDDPRHLMYLMKNAELLD